MGKKLQTTLAVLLLLMISSFTHGSDKTLKPDRPQSCPDSVKPILYPWHENNGEIRQLYQLKSQGERDGFLVTLPATPDTVFGKKSAGPLLLIDPEQPDKKIAFQFGSNGKIRNGSPEYQIRMEGKISKEKPRYLFAYRGKNIADHSKNNANPSLFNADDFATTQMGRSWSFEDGRFDQITSWGNSPDQYGKITIQDGWLNIPIKNIDVYFIFGIMWGKSDDPRALKIDSSVYRFLEMEICQSVPQSEWRIFVTDENGNYKDFIFKVEGTQKQKVRFDLSQCFPQYWGRKIFRALRIDPIKKRPNTEAKVRYVRLLTNPVEYESGPLFTKSEVQSRNRIEKISAFDPASSLAPSSLIAGSPFTLGARFTLRKNSDQLNQMNQMEMPVKVVFDQEVVEKSTNSHQDKAFYLNNSESNNSESNKSESNKSESNKSEKNESEKNNISKSRISEIREYNGDVTASSWKQSSHSREKQSICFHRQFRDLTLKFHSDSKDVEKTSADSLVKDNSEIIADEKISLRSITKASQAQSRLGLADDLGNSYRTVSQVIPVKPADFYCYQLDPESSWWDVTKKEMKIRVLGLDRFGNARPVTINKPELRLDSTLVTAEVKSILKGDPAEFVMTLKDPTVGKKITVALSDGQGNSCQTELTTIKYRKTRVFLNPNGFPVREDGSPYLAVGGLYGNWPHRPTGYAGQLTSMDLFPCGPKSYQYGFPWPKEVEKNVRIYFDHCRKHGINTIRLMLRNMDLVGQADKTQLDAVVHYMKIGYEYGIRFNVVLFEDYQKPPYMNRDILEQVVLPHYTQAQLDALPEHRARFLVRKELVQSVGQRYYDPDILKCQKDYLRQIIPVLAEQEAVFCYEFENEMHEYPGDSWCQSTIDFIRSIDPNTLILGNPDTMTRTQSLPWRGSGCDLIAYHTYNNGLPNADMGTYIVLKANWTRLARKVFLTGEGGVYDFKAVNPKIRQEKEVQGIRDHIWCNFCSGGIAFMYWTLINEPIANEIDKIVTGLKAVKIDLSTMTRKQPEIAILVPDLSSGMEGDRAMDAQVSTLIQKLLERGCDFDCVLKGEEKNYPIRLDCHQSEIPSDLTATVAQPSSGWNVVTLVSKNDRQTLLYLRNNIGGVRNFSAIAKIPRYFRDNQPGIAELKLTEPGHWKKIIAYDLETGAVETVIPDASGRIVLKKTAGDYLLGLHD